MKKKKTEKEKIKSLNNRISEEQIYRQLFQAAWKSELKEAREHAAEIEMETEPEQSPIANLEAYHKAAKEKVSKTGTKNTLSDWLRDMRRLYW